MLEINCLRCNVPMQLATRKEFYEANAWGGAFVNRNDRFDLYLCSQCGKVEFFMARVVDANQVKKIKSEQTSPKEKAFEVQLAEAGSNEPLPQDKLLRINPNQFVLEDVYAAVGYPTAVQYFRQITALHYPSEREGVPHIVLLDNKSRRIKAVAIYNNDHQFTLTDLTFVGVHRGSRVFSGDVCRVN
jgi:hypothetical protein